MGHSSTILQMGCPTYLRIQKKFVATKSLWATWTTLRTTALNDSFWNILIILYYVFLYIKFFHFYSIFPYQKFYLLNQLIIFLFCSYSCAIVKECSNSLKANGSLVETIKREHLDFINTLRHLGMDVVEISSNSSIPQRMVYNTIGDLVFILNGVALLLHPLDRIREQEVCFNQYQEYIIL